MKIKKEKIKGKKRKRQETSSETHLVPKIHDCLLREKATVAKRLLVCK